MTTSDLIPKAVASTPYRFDALHGVDVGSDSAAPRECLVLWFSDCHVSVHSGDTPWLLSAASPETKPGTGPRTGPEVETRLGMETTKVGMGTGELGTGTGTGTGFVAVDPGAAAFAAAGVLALGAGGCAADPEAAARLYRFSQPWP